MENVIEKPGFTLEVADESEFEQVAAFNSAHGFGLQKTEWLQWKYSQNPDGPGMLYVLRDVSGTIVGTLGYIPKRSNSETNLDSAVYELVDGFVAPEFRKKGLYSWMLIYSLHKIKAPVLAFPNELARKTPLKIGFDVCSRIDIWTFPINPILSVLKRKHILLGLFSWIFYQCYRLIFLSRNSFKIDIAPVEKFEEYFRDSEGRVRKHISAAFLNWRFIDNPLRSYFCRRFILGDNSIGFCVFTIEGASIELFDFVAEKLEKACFRALADYCWKEGFTHIVFPGVGMSLRKFGFLKRTAKKRFVLTSGYLPMEQGTIKLRDSDW